MHGPDAMIGILEINFLSIGGPICMYMLITLFNYKFMQMSFSE